MENIGTGFEAFKSKFSQLKDGVAGATAIPSVFQKGAQSVKTFVADKKNALAEIANKHGVPVNFGNAAGQPDWLRKLQNNYKLDAVTFVETWQHYDTDGNGYIEGEEITAFLRDLLQSGGQEVTDDVITKIRADFMNEFDDNRDGKIDFTELARILPTEENFLMIFRKDNPMTSSRDFTQVWRKYVPRGKDYLEISEVKDFLHDLLASSGTYIDEDKMDVYANSVIKLYDTNKDGKLSFQELSRLLPAEENHFLLFRADEHDYKVMSRNQFDNLFYHYDKDGNDVIEGHELPIFLRDVAESVHPGVAHDSEKMRQFERMIMTACDISNDGRLQKEEVALWLGVTDA